MMNLLNSSQYSLLEGETKIKEIVEYLEHDDYNNLSDLASPSVFLGERSSKCINISDSCDNKLLTLTPVKIEPPFNDRLMSDLFQDSYIPFINDCYFPYMEELSRTDRYLSESDQSDISDLDYSVSDDTTISDSNDNYFVSTNEALFENEIFYQPSLSEDNPKLSDYNTIYDLLKFKEEFSERTSDSLSYATRSYPIKRERHSPSRETYSAPITRNNVPKYKNVPKQSDGRKKPGRKPGQPSNGYHLWQFMRDLLLDDNICPKYITWVDKDKGIFKICNSDQIAKMWGARKKNKTPMTYEKLSRAIRFSRTAGYFSELPKNAGYPRKLCFMFGPRTMIGLWKNNTNYTL